MWDPWMTAKIAQAEELEQRLCEILERTTQRQKRDNRMTGTPQFADISTFNPLHIDWQAYKQWSAQWDGTSRVAMRSSYGVGYTDSHFAEYRAGALTANIDMILMYHYSYPQYNFPASEAAWQKKVIGQIRPQDILILDFEESTPSASSAWALAWLTQQEVSYGKLPGIYASSAYIQARLQDTRLAKYPLWLANWQYTPDARPPCPAPWSQHQYLQYTDHATNIPGIAGTVDANIFVGAPPMQLYGPGHGDFDLWFVADTGNNWICKQTNAVIMDGNKGLYSQISLDGNTLPIIGLPRTSELYQQESDGYSWSVQFFERGVIVYDPSHRQDSQPGCGASYFGKYPQFAHLDPG